MIPTLFGMSLISFFIIQLPPGDFLTSLISAIADSGQGLDQASVARLTAQYGLDQPIYVQYWKWISGILFRGDFARSARRFSRRNCSDRRAHAQGRRRARGVEHCLHGHGRAALQLRSGP